MLVKIFGGAVYGINALTITIEVNILWGAKFIIVGLPDNAVKESQQRIDSALREIGLKIPGKRVIINMAPADVKKEGSSFDLPLAIGILAANDQLPNAQLDKYLIMGELSLDGSLQAVKGVLPIAIHAKKEGFKGILLPYQNANEAAVVQDFEVYDHTLELVIRVGKYYCDNVSCLQKIFCEPLSFLVRRYGRRSYLVEERIRSISLKLTFRKVSFLLQLFHITVSSSSCLRILQQYGQHNLLMHNKKY